VFGVSEIHKSFLRFMLNKVIRLVVLHLFHILTFFLGELRAINRQFPTFSLVCILLIAANNQHEETDFG